MIKALLALPLLTAAAIVVGRRRDRGAWEQAIDQMIGRGAEISDAEYEAIAAYLGTNFAP